MRMRLSVRAAFAVLGAVAFLGTSSTAMADARTEARSYFKRGMAAIANGNYESGISELKKAYETLPHPNVLYNIARAYVEMGDLENAISYYKQYVEQNPPDKDEVNGVISALQTRVDKQRAALAASQRTGPGTGPGTPGTGPGTPGTGPGTTPGTGPGTGPGTTPGTGPGTGPGVVEPGLPPIAGKGAAIKDEEGLYEEKSVTASRGGAISPLDSPSTIAIITEQDIRLSGITKIPDLIRRVAGSDVMATSGGQGEISFRGFNQRLSNKVLVLIDGRSVFADWNGGVFWETLTIDVDQIERIEVVKGPGSALYGADAMTGVVNIITKPPGTGKNQARVGIGDSLQAYGSIRATGRDQSGFAYRASAGYSRYPRWSREAPSNRIDLQLYSRNQDLASEMSRFDIRTTKQLGKDAVFGIGGGYVQGFVDFYTIGALKEYNLDARVGDVTAFINTKKFTLRSFWNFGTYNLGKNHEYVGSDLLKSSIATNVVDVEGVYADKFATGSINHSVNVGANYRLRSADAAYTQGLIDEHHYGFFAQETATFSKAVQVVLGGRLDYVPYNRRFEVSPRGSVIVHPSAKSTVRGTVSSAFRKPTFNEGYLQLGVQVPTGSVQSTQDTERNGRFNPERILSAEIAYLNQENEKFDLEVTGYYNRVTALATLLPNVFLSPNQRFEGGVDRGFDYAAGRYTIGYGAFGNQCNVFNVLGGEIGVKTYPTQGLDVFANYALNHTIVDTPAGCDVPSDRRTSAHKVNLGVQVRSKPGIDGELLLHIVSNQRWVERDFDAVVGGVIFKEYILPAYALLNARIGWRFASNKAEVSATAFNLLNNVHQEHPFTQFVGRRFMGFFQYQF